MMVLFVCPRSTGGEEKKGSVARRFFFLEAVLAFDFCNAVWVFDLTFFTAVFIMRLLCIVQRQINTGVLMAQVGEGYPHLFYKTNWKIIGQEILTARVDIACFTGRVDGLFRKRSFL